MITECILWEIDRSNHTKLILHKSTDYDELQNLINLNPNTRLYWLGMRGEYHINYKPLTWYISCGEDDELKHYKGYTLIS